MRIREMRLKAILACCLLLAGSHVLAATNNLWFPVGEELDYTLYWGVLTVGQTHIETHWIEEGGRQLLAIRFVAKSSRVVSALFPVNDWMESVVDPETFLPVRFSQRIREGDKKRDDTVIFDYKAGKAVWKADEPSSTNVPAEIAIEQETRDILCFLYYMRSKEFREGTTNTFRVLVDDKLYKLTVAGLELQDVYLSHFGDVRCIELEPKAQFGEIFVRKGSVNMWVSDDERRICAKALAIVPVANVKMVLQKVSGPGGDFWTSGRRKSR